MKKTENDPVNNFSLEIIWLDIFYEAYTGSPMNSEFSKEYFHKFLSLVLCLGKYLEKNKNRRLLERYLRQKVVNQNVSDQVFGILDNPTMGKRVEGQ